MPSRVTLVSSALTVVAVLSLAAQTTQQKPADPQRPTFKTEANYVRVDVYPTQNGSPVKGLTVADFDLLRRRHFAEDRRLRVRAGARRHAGRASRSEHDCRVA
jgi:hypothetical protein